LRERFSSPVHIGYLRKRIAELLGEASRSANLELTERRRRLERTEARIAKLIEFIAGGNDSSYVKDALRDLEAQARSEKDAIAAIEARAKAPVRLPTPVSGGKGRGTAVSCAGSCRRACVPAEQ
jgi:hypothetical protein